MKNNERPEEPQMLFCSRPTDRVTCVCLSQIVRESYRCLIRPFLFSSGVGEVLCIRTPCATCLLAVVLTLVAAAATGVSLNEDYVSADDEEVVQEGRSTDGGSNKKEKYEVGVSSDPPVTEPVTPFHHQNGEKMF